MKSLRQLIYKKISEKYMNGCSNYNSLEVRRGCRSKQQARAIFDTGNIPHAKGAIFFNPFMAHRFAKEYGFPLVIKPNVSGFSRGSYFPIYSYKELWRAALLAKLWWPSTVVEQYLEGDNYRVVMLKDGIMSVIERYPPFVKGNGLATISELIDEENAIRKKMKLYPCISPLQKSKQTIGFLKKQGLTLNSIPKAGQCVKLFYRISLAPGGVTKIIDKSSISSDNIEMFHKVIDLFGANILGIDVIFEKGIDVSHKKQKVIFLEVNSRPYLKMHEFPRYGNKEDLSSYFEVLNKLEVSGADIF